MSDNEMAEAIREFLTESRDNLDQFESNLLAAEADAGGRTHLAALFRSIHSIKGSCGFLGYAKIESVSHAGETLLARIRDGHVRLDGKVVSALLEMVDAIRVHLTSIDATGHEAEAEIEHVVRRLDAWRTAREGDLENGEEHHEVPAFVDGRFAASDGKIRVDVALLDRLMNLVGELVLARNQLQKAVGELAGSTLNAPTQRLNLVTAEIQEAVMKTRMQPIGNVWNRFPRLARDIARSAGKVVRLRLEGGHTELDKTIIEGIQDPLTHLVRNAIDHGLETAEQRTAKGKPPEGTIFLQAFHEGGMVNIEVSDDGAGIDLARVRKRAAEQKLVSHERASTMSDREAMELLFLPGFSTAQKITTLSGRGVGMDVVRTNIEKIGGSVDVQTRPGLGTAVRIKIPLTLAIIPALIVTSGGARYAIPQASLLEVVRLEPEQVAREVETVQGASVFRLRGKLLPLAFLRAELAEGEARATPDEAISIVVLQADDRSYGLVVDEIRDTEEIVVKPIWKRLKNLGCYAGATVMGDGAVALILDAIGLGQRVGVVGDSRQRTVAHEETRAEPKEAEELVLLCRIGAEGRLAIPLSKVARLEEVERSRIEMVGGRAVTQYRGAILRVIDVESALEERRSKPRESRLPADELLPTAMPVVVYAHEDRTIGLAVDAILDILSTPVSLQTRGSRAGVLGSMVIQDRITEFLNVEEVIRRVDPTFGVRASAE